MNTTKQNLSLFTLVLCVLLFLAVGPQQVKGYTQNVTTTEYNITVEGMRYYSSALPTKYFSYWNVGARCSFYSSAMFLTDTEYAKFISGESYSPIVKKVGTANSYVFLSVGKMEQPLSDQYPDNKVIYLVISNAANTQGTINSLTMTRVFIAPKWFMPVVIISGIAILLVAVLLYIVLPVSCICCCVAACRKKDRRSRLETVPLYAAAAHNNSTGAYQSHVQQAYVASSHAPVVYQTSNQDYSSNVYPSAV